MSRLWLFVFLVFSLLATTPAEAKKWTVDYARSKLAFEGSAGGVSFTGHFKSFFAEVDFDPADTKKAVIHAVIDMPSAVTGDAQKDAALPQKEWFDSKNWPQAEFSLVELKKSGEGRFQARARLSMKGSFQDVFLPFSMMPDRDAYRVQGTLTLNRHDFKVGEGEWASDALVGRDVKVIVDLVMY